MVHGDFSEVGHCNSFFVVVLIPAQLKILVNDSGCPQIIDFGLSVFFYDIHVRLDTMDGISRPRTMWKERPSKESDVYSFAVVAVEVGLVYQLASP